MFGITVEMEKFLRIITKLGVVRGHLIKFPHGVENKMWGIWSIGYDE